jgi:hypothetical protein
VIATTLNGLDASSGSEVKSTGFFRGSECRISARSGGEINYNGKPQILNVEKSSGGSVSFSQNNYFCRYIVPDYPGTVLKKL